MRQPSGITARSMVEEEPMPAVSIRTRCNMDASTAGQEPSVVDERNESTSCRGDGCPCCERYRRSIPELMRIMDDSNRAIAMLMARTIDSEEAMGRRERNQVLDRRREALLQMEWQRASAIWLGRSLVSREHHRQ